MYALGRRTDVQRQHPAGLHVDALILNAQSGRQPSALGAGTARRRRPGRDIDHVRSEAGEEHIGALNGRAAVGDIGRKHARAGAKGIRRRTLVERHTLGLVAGRHARLDGDVGAVHVHFAVADVVEPGPGKDGLAGRRVVGQRKWPGRLERAAANVRLNGREGVAAVVRERDLAAAAIVRGAALDAKCVATSSAPRHDGAALRRVEQGVVALARKVGPVGGERVDHVVVNVGRVRVVLGAERRRARHLHVPGRHRDEAQDGGQGERRKMHGCLRGGNRYGEEE